MSQVPPQGPNALDSSQPHVIIQLAVGKAVNGKESISISGFHVTPPAQRVMGVMETSAAIHHILMNAFGQLAQQEREQTPQSQILIPSGPIPGLRG